MARGSAGAAGRPSAKEGAVSRGFAIAGDEGLGAVLGAERRPAGVGSCRGQRLPRKERRQHSVGRICVIKGRSTATMAQ